MEFYVSIGFTVLLQVLKERKQAAKFRTAFFKVYRAIHFAFMSDPDFVAMNEGLAAGTITQ